MFSAFVNCFKIPELRQRILLTLGCLAVVRLTTTIPCPGINAEKLSRLFQNSGNLLDFVNMFSGGALEKFAVGALGIMPYISASIIMQILTPVLPDLERLQREGDHGRQKLNQYTRYLTVFICLIQGFVLAQTMLNPQFLGGRVSESLLIPGMNPTMFVVLALVIMTGGTMLTMWLGERITEIGIGNGASIIITANILDRLPSAVRDLWREYSEGSDLTAIHMILIAAAFCICCAGTVALATGVRKIPIRHAGRAGGGRVAQGQETYLPLRVNFSSVMPIIFASALLALPPLLLNWLQSWLMGRGWSDMKNALGQPDWHNSVLNAVSWIHQNISYGEPMYLCLEATLILGFSYFWVANQFNPVRIADELQASGGYIPGLRPGQPTAEYLDRVMTQITFAGSIFLTVLALTPTILIMQSQIFQSSPQLAQFFGGTTLLIVVGVTLDTMKQAETILLNHNYQGFLSKGQLRSRRG